MSDAVVVRRVAGLTAPELADLTDLLVAVVGDGASVGFLSPLDPAPARAYWERVNAAAEDADGLVLLLAEIDGRVVGTAQLQPAESANGRHRGEVAKVLVHPGWQRRGIGRQLMLALEPAARAQGRTLLVLDTREGDPSNRLYAACGWTEAGRVPNWARNADGTLSGTVFWYKELAG